MEKKSYDCLQSIIVKVAIELNKNYEMISVGDWGFVFDYDSNDVLKIRFDKICQIMRRFHGIQILLNEIENNEKTRYIKNNLREGQELFVLSDIYYCPWSRSYHKYHYTHFYIIKNFCKDNNVILLDPYFQDGVINISYDLIEEGIIKIGHIFENNYNILHTNYHEVLKEDILFILNRNSYNSLYNLYNFSSYVKNIDFKEIIHYYQEDFYAIPIIDFIEKSCVGRISYSKLLLYISNLIEKENLYDFSFKLLEIAENWKYIKNKMIKYIIKNEEYKAIDFLTETTEKMADKEISIANEILRIM